MRQLTLDDVSVEVSAEPEWQSPDGEFDTGDKELDARIVRDIKRRRNLTVWAWCTVTVRVAWRGHTGKAHLGCCSYRSEKDFRQGGYFGDLADEALDELNAKLAGLRSDLQLLEAA